jgi:ABC-type oligopeptide transport system substrate-binding subunit
MKRRTQRATTAAIAAILLIALAAGHASADGPRHGLSAFGDLAYPADFKHALIAKMIEAGSRQELEAATRALDRVLRVGPYWVPQWYNHSWWYDPIKAAKLKNN